MEIKAPCYSESDIRRRAMEFLAKHHASDTIPVPIEKIVDLDFGMEIVPVPGLHKNFDVDAYITSDLQEIRVDEYVYESRENR